MGGWFFFFFFFQAEDGIRDIGVTGVQTCALPISFARDLIETRGHVGDVKLQAFLDAGYDKRQALEVLTGLATKLLSNFTNALAHTELEIGRASCRERV